MTSRRLLLLTLALAMPLRAAYAQGSSTYGDTARVRQELAAEYAIFREAFIKNAPEAWSNALDSSFSLTLFNGTIMSKDWVEDYVRTNAKQFHIRSLGCGIQSLTVRADTAVCSVCGSEVR